MHSSRFRIIQGGVSVAEVSGEDRSRALAEIYRYAAQYRADGPLSVQEQYHTGRRWAWRNAREFA